MTFRDRTLAVGCVLLYLCPMGAAQTTPSSATGTGTVTGHVVCSDTQRPARYAAVILFGVPAEVTAPSATPNDLTAARASMRAGLGNVNLVQGRTGLDGSFALSDVPPGDYYAFPAVAGYVQPAGLVAAAYAAGADPHKPIPGVPVLHIAADRTSTVELAAQRGAAVSGRLLWDDGAPVARTIVQVESSSKKSELPTQFAMLAGVGAMNGGPAELTDDLGHFRIAGLAPGEYVVKASLNTGSQFAMVHGAMQLGNMLSATPLTVYAPAAVHKTAAQTITVTSGEDKTGEDITINLGGMHSVSGRVRSSEDGHGLNAATVKLTDAADKDFARSAGVDATGAYTVTLLPPGTYNLTVTDAEDTRPSPKKGTGVLNFESTEAVRSYADGKGSVVVIDSDIAGQNVDMTPEKQTKQKPDLNELLKP